MVQVVLRLMCVAALFVAPACSTMKARGEAAPPSTPVPGSNALRSDAATGAVPGAGGPIPAVRKTIVVDRDLDGANALIAYVKQGSDDERVRDLTVELIQMPGVASIDSAYGTETIKVVFTSTATGENVRKVRDHLIASGLVSRVE
ncbi:MAG: hypothetical protein ACREV8_00050 [Gammaproteobacteria bacterium]